MSAMNGIDVSSWQPANIGDLVDYDFLIAKATEGTSYVNPNCSPAIQSAISRGKCHGTYHFASVGSAVAQADYYLDNIAGYIGKGIMVLDYEANATSQGYSWVKAWCQRVIDKTGIKPLVYASLSVVQSQRLDKIMSELNCGIWVAAYPNNNTQGYSQPSSPVSGAIMYQYTSSGRLSGYGGNLDLNVFYGDESRWADYARGGRIVDVSDVWEGKTISGDNRVETGDEGRKWLVQMGYANKYEKVFIFNAMMLADAIEAHTLALHSGGIAIGVFDDRNNLTLAVAELEKHRGEIVELYRVGGEAVLCGKVMNRLKLAAGIE